MFDRDPIPPPIRYLKVSGGMFKDMSIHSIDVLRWFLEEEIDEVFAEGCVLIDKRIKSIPDYDTMSAILKSKSGILCQIINSRRHTPGFDQRIEIFCEKVLEIKGNLYETIMKCQNFRLRRAINTEITIYHYLFCIPIFIVSF